MSYRYYVTVDNHIKLCSASLYFMHTKRFILVE